MTNKPIDLARLSDAVYKGSKKGMPQGGYADKVPTGYSYIDSSNENSEGYFGAAFRNGNTVVIAHRGTGIAQRS